MFDATTVPPHASTNTLSTWDCSISFCFDIFVLIFVASYSNNNNTSSLTLPVHSVALVCSPPSTLTLIHFFFTLVFLLFLECECSAQSTEWICVHIINHILQIKVPIREFICGLN
eukprot:779914_1